MASDDDDPRAPYKVYEGDELKGTYATRAEARPSATTTCGVRNRNVTSYLHNLNGSLYDARAAEQEIYPR